MKFLGKLPVCLKHNTNTSFSDGVFVVFLTSFGPQMKSYIRRNKPIRSEYHLNSLTFFISASEAFGLTPSKSYNRVSDIFLFKMAKPVIVTSYRTCIMNSKYAQFMRTSFRPWALKSPPGSYPLAIFHEHFYTTSLLQDHATIKHNCATGTPILGLELCGESLSFMTKFVNK